MCFSPEVSFLSSAGLGFAGAAVLQIAPPQKKILAIVPLVFALQQGLEGIQWLYLRGGTTCASAAYGFIFFALMGWPVIVPAVVYWIDPDRRNVMRWFVAAGCILSMYFLVMIISEGVGIIEFDRSIQYQLYSVFGNGAPFLYYLTVTVGPMFISSMLSVRLFSVIALILAALAQYYYSATFVSVWCFFSAVLSVLILVYLIYAKRRESAMIKT